MPSSFLAVNWASGTPQLKRYNGLSCTFVGNTITGSTAAAYTAAGSQNRAIQFGNAFYAVLAVNATTGGVFRSTDNGTTWATVLTFTVFSGGNYIVSGLNIIYSNGIPLLVFMATNSLGNAIIGYRSTDGITWTSDTSAAFNVGTNFTSDVVYRGNLYCTMTGNSNSFRGVASYSPGAVSLIDAGTSTTTIGGTTSLCVYKDLLYFACVENTFRRVYVLDGGGFSLIANLGTFTGNVSAKSAMLADGDYLYVFMPKNATGTWGCWQLDSAYTVVDLTTTVLPIGMTSADVLSTSRALSFVDGQAVPGADPTKYLLFTNATNAPLAWTMYKWMGPSNRMQNEAVGGLVADSMCVNKNVTGSTFWTYGDYHIELVNRTAVSNGTRLTFNIYSSTASTPTIDVRIWYGIDLEDYPTRSGTLVDPTNGSISGGNVNTGVVINNGASTYQVTWNTITDGVTVGQRIILVMAVSNP